MQSRTTMFLDRLVVLLVGLALLAAGGLTIWWWQGSSPVTTQAVPLGAVTDLTRTAWWPWASGVVGLVLVVVGLLWTRAHLSRQRIGHLHLAGSGATGRLDVVAAKVASAAAEELADIVDVRSARGVVVRDRGQLVARLHAVLEPEADLAVVARRADEVSAQLGQVLGRQDLRCRVELRVAARRRSLPRAS